jgi:hypothetical protein
VAEIEITCITLAELANRTHNKQIIDMVNELTKTIPVLEDAKFSEANDLTAHYSTKVVSLPSASLRAANQGVVPTAGQTKQIVDHICSIEDLSEVDEYLVDKAPDPQTFRFNEDLLHMEGMRQKYGSQYFYGSRINDIKEIDGLHTRYGSLSLPNVRSCGGTGSDVSSLWFVGHGANRVFNVYPLGGGSKIIQRIDKGLELVIVNTTTGEKLYKYITQFKFDFGLVVRDERYVQRLCNIETSGAANTLNIDLMIDAYNDLPSTDGVVIYCHKKIKSQFDKLAKDKPNVLHTMADPFGKPVLYFWDIPIKKCDSILDTETALT